MILTSVLIAVLFPCLVSCVLAVLSSPYKRNSVRARIVLVITRGYFKLHFLPLPHEQPGAFRLGFFLPVGLLKSLFQGAVIASEKAVTI